MGFAGEELTDWVELISRSAKKAGVRGSIGLSKMGAPVSRILGVGESYVLFETSSARTIAALASTDEVSMSFCYCSVLEDCWILDLPAGEGAEETTSPVPRCPTYPKKFTGWPPGQSKKWAESILDAGPEAGSFRAPVDGG